MPAALRAETAFVYPKEMTIEVLFSPQRLPTGSESRGYLISPVETEEEPSSGAGRALWMHERQGVMTSSIGVGPFERTLLEWDFAPEEGHWYYVVILVRFDPDYTNLSVYVADLTKEESQMRAVLQNAGLPQRNAVFTESGRPISFGVGPRGVSHSEMRSPPTLWDEVIISKGHLTPEQMRARLAALLKR
jgi:hypothetical protein